MTYQAFLNELCDFCVADTENALRLSNCNQIIRTVGFHRLSERERQNINSSRCSNIPQDSSLAEINFSEINNFLSLYVLLTRCSHNASMRVEEGS